METSELFVSPVLSSGSLRMEKSKVHQFQICCARRGGPQSMLITLGNSRNGITPRGILQLVILLFSTMILHCLPDGLWLESSKCILERTTWCVWQPSKLVLESSLAQSQSLRYCCPRNLKFELSHSCSHYLSTTWIKILKDCPYVSC